MSTEGRLDYGEILFLGKCNNKCYYCLGNEMLKARLVNNMETPYNELKNLDMFLNRLKDVNCSIIYLSSVETEPLLYKDINNLCDYLISKGFKLGIRTNGLCCYKFLNIIPLLSAEISISINSLDPSINKLICGNENTPNMENIFNVLHKNNKKCRISIVINCYNVADVMFTVDFLQAFDCISYIQLRKRYKYSDNIKDPSCHTDHIAFNRVKKMLSVKYKDVPKTNFHESIIYNTKVPISLWEDVFKKESLNTLNYFTDGKITTNNLLVPGYENK